MNNLIDTANSLDLDGWIRGILQAGISAGASSISSGTIATGLAPDTFNFYNRKFYILTAGTFLFSGFISIMKFLAIHPIPDKKIMEKTVEVTEKPGAKPITITTVKETSIESVGGK